MIVDGNKYFNGFQQVFLVLNFLLYWLIMNIFSTWVYSIIWCLFGLQCSIPPLAVVGLSEEQAIEQANGDILVFTSSFNPMKNTISQYVKHLSLAVCSIVLLKHGLVSDTATLNWIPSVRWCDTHTDAQMTYTKVDTHIDLLLNLLEENSCKLESF